MNSKAVLNSWKEVAQYVGRSTRTLQRWERELGFPVHRPYGKRRSAIIAIPEEIDAWIQNTPTATARGAAELSVRMFGRPLRKPNRARMYKVAQPPSRKLKADGRRPRRA